MHTGHVKRPRRRSRRCSSRCALPVSRRTRAWCSAGAWGRATGPRGGRRRVQGRALPASHPNALFESRSGRSHGETRRDDPGTAVRRVLVIVTRAPPAAPPGRLLSFAAPSAVVRDADAGMGFSKVTVHFAGFRRTRLVAIRASSSFGVRHTGALASASESGFTLAARARVAESPAVANAAPSAVSADGGTAARLTGPPGREDAAHVFVFVRGGGELPGTTLPGGTTPFCACFWTTATAVGALNAATTATVVFSSALAACESPPARAARTEATRSAGAWTPSAAAPLLSAKKPQIPFAARRSRG